MDISSQATATMLLCVLFCSMADSCSSFINFLFLLVVFAFLCSAASGLLGRGFGEHIDWKTYPEGLKEAQASQKPVMLLIHKSWCGACKALKPKFAESKGIDELSKSFVMINVEDDEEPQDPKFHIDGSYIPRIFILDSAGIVQKDIYNKNGNPSYKYYYGNTGGIVSSMKEALELMVDGKRIGDEL